MAYLAEFSPQARLSMFASIRKNTPFRYWVLLNVVGGFGLIVFMACHMEDIYYWWDRPPAVTEFLKDTPQNKYQTTRVLFSALLMNAAENSPKKAV